MPRASRWLVRTALAWLLAGLVLLVLRSLPASGPAAAWLGAAGPAALHALTVGWLTQLAFGVAHWMFPRHPAGPQPRAEGQMMASWACLNGGLVARLVAEPGVLLGAGGSWQVVLVAAGVLQLAAAVLFVVNAWPRVRTRP